MPERGGTPLGIWMPSTGHEPHEHTMHPLHSVANAPSEGRIMQQRVDAAPALHHIAPGAAKLSVHPSIHGNPGSC